MGRKGVAASAVAGWVIIAGACLPAAWATSSFQSALSEYRAGHYDAAHAGFLSLAELGDCSSQFNLGAMALHGQGGPKDPGSGAGWLEAAAGNGCGQLVGDRLRGLTASLNAEETRAAAAIMARYGPEALHAQGIVNPEFTCRDLRPASVAAATEPDTSDAAIARYPALVITALTIGTDGHARDPEVLLALPAQGFAAAAVEAWLNSQFAPAQGAGGPAASRLEAKTLFARGTGSLANTEQVRSVRSAAEAGDPAASYLLGLAGAYDGNADAQYWVASQLRASAACHPRADGEVWLRHAAEGGSAAAQLLLARDLLGGTAGAAQLEQARALLEQAAHADSYYVRKHVVALFAASPVDAVRNAPAALELARRLSAGEIKSDPQMFESVAAAYAANGDFRNATAQQQIAVEKASALRWKTRAMQERLDAYRHGKAWRGDLLASS